MPGAVNDVLAKELEQYTQNFLTLLEALPEEALWRTEPNLPNAIGTLARHLTGNLNHYFGTALLKSGYIRARDQEFAERSVSKAKVIAELREAADIAGKALAQVDGEQLSKPFTTPDGTEFKTLAACIAQMTMHFAMHYGQADYAQHVLHHSEKSRAIGKPQIDSRPAQPYMGIRVQTPMRGMSKAVTKLFKELNTWAKQQKVEPVGPPLLRYHVIDMAGDMDIEVCLPVSAPLPANGRVTAGEIPAGRYASLVYIGSGYSGNKALVDWAKANNIAWDRWDDPKGDAFRSRYESYLTDPKIEPRRTRWEVEVAIKLADE